LAGIGKRFYSEDPNNRTGKKGTVGRRAISRYRENDKRSWPGEGQGGKGDLRGPSAKSDISMENLGTLMREETMAA